MPRKGKYGRTVRACKPPVLSHFQLRPLSNFFSKSVFNGLKAIDGAWDHNRVALFGSECNEGVEAFSHRIQ